MPEIIYGNQDRSSMVVMQVPFVLPAVTTAGQVAAFQLSGAAGTWVHRAWINVTTGSTGACTLDVGIGATAATSSDLLLDGKSVATAGIFDSHNDTDNGTNGVAKPQLCAGTFITATIASGDAAGLVGTLHVLVSGDL